MFWGVKHARLRVCGEQAGYGYRVLAGAAAAGYEAPVTRFTQVLNSKGENLTLHPVNAAGERTVYGEA